MSYEIKRMSEPRFSGFLDDHDFVLIVESCKSSKSRFRQHHRRMSQRSITHQRCRNDKKWQRCM